jgi:phytoene desaturase
VRRDRVVVIGAGLGGLAAACRLAGAGHAVTVLERAAGPGGRAGRLQLGEYTFDTGPTVLTMSGLLADTFAAAGVAMEDVLTLIPLDPMYRAVFADGSVIKVRRGREAMAAEIAAVCGSTEADAFGRFCDWLTELYVLERDAFIDRNFDAPVDLVWPLRPALRLLQLGGLRNLARKVASFFHDERLQRLFSFQSLYAGLAPQRALAVYSVITYMDTVEGVLFPVGGMAAVGTALATAAEKAGAEFRFDCEVDRVLLARGTSGAVTGVRLASGEVVAADVVVCNPDLPVAYRTLLPGTPPPRRTRTGTYSPSAVLWHGGGRGPLPAEAAHHNIHFGDAWRSAFEALLDDGRPMPDPSILVSVPTMTEPGMAPPGGHVLYALEPVPNLDGAVDWVRERDAARSRLLAQLAAAGYPTQADVETFVDPLDWERDGMERGTPFALAHRFFQSGPFRPGNVDRRAPGLVFVGSGTVPGVGVPMVLLSGRLAALRVEAHQRA